MTTKSLGVLLKSRRESTFDPTTGRPYTQAGLATAAGVSRSTINAIENSEVATIDAAKANRLAELLDLPVDDLVRAMGFRVGLGTLAPDEAELVRLYRRVPAGARFGLIAIARSAAQTLSELQAQIDSPKKAAG